MMRLLALPAALLAATPGVRGDCASAKTCDTCTGAPNCGWCQPGPIVWKNGSVGSRCGDNSQKAEWECPGSYTTGKCSVSTLLPSFVGWSAIVRWW
jgi:hypothetical protein